MKNATLALVTLFGLTLAGLSAAQAPAPVAPAAPAAAPAVKSGDAMEGLAAVYSDKLNGRKTASGQVFSQSALSPIPVLF